MNLPFSYRGPGSNRHGHHCPQDFKSGVSTYSTTAAFVENYLFLRKAVQRYCFFLKYASIFHFFSHFFYKNHKKLAYMRNFM